MGKQHSAEELADILQKENPGRSFAISKDGNAIGVLCEELAIWYPVIAKVISGGWATVDFNIRAGEELVWKQDAWVQHTGIGKAKVGT